MIRDIPQSVEDDFQILKDGWDLGEVDRDTEEIWASLRSYIHLLYRWANKLNLVSLSEINVLATKHIWRSLAMLPYIQSVNNHTIIDVGSGSGLPAIPLKICLPSSQFYLVESRRKRANFLREVIRGLGLKKIEVVNERVENWTDGISGDVITARAVASPSEIERWAKGHISSPSWLICTLEKSGLGLNRQGREVLCTWGKETMRLGVIPLTCEQVK